MKVEDQHSLCPLCQGPLLAKDFGLLFLRCQRCQLLIRNSSLKDDDLNNLYQASWNDPISNLDETGGTNIRLARDYAAHFLKTLDLPNFQGMRLLDFGAGRGDMVQALQEQGADVYAVEPYGYDYLATKNVNVFHDIQEIAEKEKFNGIISLDVVEHLPAPWKTLSTLKGYLEDDGWIFISTPNSGSLNARIYKRRWREALRPGHLFLFDSRSAKEMIIKANFRKFYRLNWNVLYSTEPVVQVKNGFLRRLKLDGELRYILFNK